MINSITANFQECVKYLKESRQLNSYRQIAQHLGMHPQCLSDILHAKREVTIQILSDMVKTFNCNPLFIHHGEGEMFLSGEESQITQKDDYNEITYVSVAAQAGYVDQMLDPIYSEELPTFVIPDKQYLRGIHRCFDVEGDSMEPTIYDNDKVICRVIDQSLWLQNIRTNLVYVFVTNTGVVIKRVKAVNKEIGTLTLSSDNDFYEDFVISFDSILEVSTLITIISNFRPTENQNHKAVQEEMKTLKQTVAQQSQLIEQLNRTMTNATEPSYA